MILEDLPDDPRFELSDYLIRRRRPPFPQTVYAELDRLAETKNRAYDYATVSKAASKPTSPLHGFLRRLIAQHPPSATEVDDYGSIEGAAAHRLIDMALSGRNVDDWGIYLVGRSTRRPIGLVISLRTFVRCRDLVRGRYVEDSSGKPISLEHVTGMVVATLREWLTADPDDDGHDGVYVDDILPWHTITEDMLEHVVHEF